MAKVIVRFAFDPVTYLVAFVCGLEDQNALWSFGILTVYFSAMHLLVYGC
ncbi:hypothetical protein DSUL_80070 [Desulfovibrionales bacterium]